MSKGTAACSVLALAVLLLAGPAHAQEAARLPLQPDSKVSIDGDSNKSAWTAHATEFTGYVKMNPDASAADPGVEAAHLTVISARLKSKKSTIMDRLMHDALKVKEHPEIVYDLTSAELAPGASAPNAFTLRTRGTLTLAGVAQEIEMTIQGARLDGGRVRFTGSHTMLMSDHQIKPPTAMFGALHTADEVTVHFDVVAGPGAPPAQ